MSDTQDQTVREFLAANAPGLLDALQEFARAWNEDTSIYWPASGLLDAIEAAGLVNNPQPSPQPAPLPAMMLGAEAFGENE